MTIEEHVPLAPLTTFKIGGPARFFVAVRTIDELKEALDFARAQNQRVLILGGGSNVLIDDKGFDGLVIKIEFAGVAFEDTVLIAGAGEQWDALVARAVREGWWGVENLSGIPGTVGAAPVQNIGAYGSELKDTIAWVEAFDTATDTVVRLQPQECDFGYRTSIFKRNRGRYIIVRVALALAKEGAPNISYKDLADLQNPGLAAIRERVLSIRAGKFPDPLKEGTAGSFFLNPTVAPEVAVGLAERYPGLPQFTVEGGVKLSLAWLLDKGCGLRGFTVGRARLFERQPLVIVAPTGTTAAEVRNLAAAVQEKVKTELLLDLEPEVRIVS